MENGTRVSDITKKFEKLNCKRPENVQKELPKLHSPTLQESNSYGEGLRSCPNSGKNIKRSNAFRTDKIVKVPHSDVLNSDYTTTQYKVQTLCPAERDVDSKRSSSNLMSKKLSSSMGHTKRPTLISDTNDNDHLLKESLGRSSINNSLSLNSSSVPNIISCNPFSLRDTVRTSKPYSFSGIIQKNTFSSDTLKKVLSSPLPPGPPPKKPPRTFQYGFESYSPAMSPEHSKPQLKPTLSNESNSPSRENRVFVPFLQRSKTEPHINLNKLNSSKLFKDGYPTNSVENVKRMLNQHFLAKQGTSQNIERNTCLNTLNCFSDSNSNNIYDVPVMAVPGFVNSRRPNTHVSSTNSLIQKFEGSSAPGGYYEPYSPRVLRKPSKMGSPQFLDDVNLNINHIGAISRENQKSVHYLCSPVHWSDTCSASTGTSPDHSQLDVQKIPAFHLKDTVRADIVTSTTSTDSDTDSTSSFVDESSYKKVRAEELSAERKGHVRKVQSMRVPSSPRSTLQTTANKLFDMILLIGISSDIERGGRVAYIKATYPANVNGGPPRWLEELCFPDATLWPPTPHRHNNYRVVLTNADGSRRYAYCRRLQPETAPFCFPLAYAILTPHNDPPFYYKILAEIENRHGQPESKFALFIQCLFDGTFPPPGARLQNRKGFGEVIEIYRSCEEPAEECETPLLNLIMSITVPVFLKILSTILLERKVILIGSNISRLSESIEGLERGLAPFCWQHTLITALPKALHDLCQAPTPYILGVLRQNLDSLSFSNIDQVLAVDIEKGVVIHRVGDEDSILPGRVAKGLRLGLEQAVAGAGVASPGPAIVSPSASPSQALLTAFAQLVGHYPHHIITSHDTGLRHFQRENFVKSPRSKSVQLFLEWFTESAMFSEFIDSRLLRTYQPGIFEKKLVELVERDSKMAASSWKGIKLNRTVKNLGDKIFDWASSS